MAKIPLYVSASGTFMDDGKGGTVARATFSPNVFGVTWEVSSVVVSTTSSGANGSSQFHLYKNAEMPSALLDGTYSGDQDVSSCDIFVQTLDKLICVWTDGDLGAIATAILNGTVNTGR